MAQVQKNEETNLRIYAFDKADEEQIILADKEVKQALVYDLNGEKQITYIGLKHITLLMSQKGQPLEVLEHKVELSGDKNLPANEKIWYAECKVRNQKTGHESIGYSEAPYYGFKGKEYDPFGRTKALSKAERNAWRKQIPELEIIKLMKATDKQGTKVLEETEKPTSTKTTGDQTTCSCPVGVRDWDYTTSTCKKCSLKFAQGTIL